MPRGRPKLIGPLMPTGGYRALTTKKRLAAKAAAYAAMPSSVMASAKRRGRPRKTSVVTTLVSTTTTPRRRSGISAFNRASAAKRAEMISQITDIARYKRRIGPSNKATPTQLASLAKARAARAAKRSGSTVAVAVANPPAPTATGRGRGRPKRIGPNLPPGGYRRLLQLNARNANATPVVATYIPDEMLF